MAVKAGNSPVFRSCRAHLSRQRSSPFDDIQHRQHGKGPVGILRQTAIAYPGEAPQPLEGQERMLDLGADAGLAAVGLPVCIGQRRVPVSPLVGEILRLRRDFLEPLPLRLAPVGAVAVKAGFLG